MRSPAFVFIRTLLALVAIDATVAGALYVAESRGELGALVRYFEYGRSVPGKLARWEETPGARGNLYGVAWRAATVAASAEKFAAAPEAHGVVRAYGMSFVNNILRAAAAERPDLALDLHSGPSAPPNFAYALFEDDRANRRPGDVVVLGVLSSVVPALAALTNATWAFEQPAPFTYPIYIPEGNGLRRIDPLVTSEAEQRSLDDDPALLGLWERQLETVDAFYSPVTFGASALDASPFARLVRRSLAKRHIEKTTSAILEDGAFPYAEVLRRMIADFAEMARADGQTPLVMLVQSRDPRDLDLLSTVRPILERDAIPYLATAEHFDPREYTGFLPDGHYRPEIDHIFGKALLRVLDVLPRRL